MDSLPEAPGTSCLCSVVWTLNSAPWLPHPDPDEIPNVSFPEDRNNTEEMVENDGREGHTETLSSCHVPGHVLTA